MLQKQARDVTAPTCHLDVEPFFGQIVGWFPDWIGQERIRSFRFDNGRLVLEADTAAWHAVLIWQGVPSWRRLLGRASRTSTLQKHSVNRRFIETCANCVVSVDLNQRRRRLCPLFSNYCHFPSKTHRQVTDCVDGAGIDVSRFALRA